MRHGAALILHDGNRPLWEDPAAPGGTGRKRGLIPRPYETRPVGYYGSIPAYTAVDMPLIPPAEWPQRLRDMRDAGMLLSHHRRRGNKGQPIPSRDQNGRGYCWFHSGTSCQLVVRARDGLPYVDLSAYAGACKIKDFRDEGGWGAQGVDFQAKYGIPSSAFWPQRSMSRANDNPRTWENALLHRVDEGWVDLQAAQYDRNLAWNQVMTCLLSGHPVVVDYNWWSHSVAALDPVDGVSLFNEGVRGESGKAATPQEFEAVWDMGDPVTGGFGCNIWNSWGDSWSDMGEGKLPPQKAVPDGSVALVTVTGSAA